MGYKEEIKKVIREFNALKETVRAKIDDINKSEKYAVDYKRVLAEQAKQECRATQEALCKKVTDIIESAKNEWLKGKAAAEKDQSFDVKLSNTLKILETVGDSMTVQELQVLVAPFKEDYYTMKILRKMFLKGNLKGVGEIFGIDNIDHNVSALDELQRNISYVFNRDIEQADTMRLLITLEMMKE